MVLAVVLVLNLSDQLLKNIFHGDEAGRTAKLIHHYGNMHLAALKLPQQIVNRFCLRYKKRRPEEVAQNNQVPMFHEGNQVLGMDHPDNIVE